MVSKKPNDNGLYEVDCSKIVNVCPKRRNIEILTNDLFVFVNVNDFVLVGCTDLKTLKGSPKEVGGNFYCDGYINLTSLEGAPKKVGETFVCYPNFTEEDVRYYCDVKGQVKIIPRYNNI